MLSSRGMGVVWHAPYTALKVVLGSRFRALFGKNLNLRTNAGPIVNYDVTRDVQRFVFVQPLEEAGDAVERPQIIVVQNWFEELKERVPLP